MNPVPFLRDRIGRLLSADLGILASLLVGSYARGTATSESDVDVMLIAVDPCRLLQSGLWLEVFGAHSQPAIEHYGEVTSIRISCNGATFELSIASPKWLGLPLDSGTRKVLADGYQILHAADKVMEPIQALIPPIGWKAVVPFTVESYWQRFLDSRGDPLNYSGLLFGWFQFSVNPDYLASLVLDGVKRGTTSLWGSWEREGTEVPKAGSFSVIQDGAGLPLCVVELEKVEILRYDEFDETRAKVEGEGQRDLASWKQLHKDFLDSECRKLGREMTDSELIVFETFRLVFSGTNLTSTST